MAARANMATQVPRWAWDIVMPNAHMILKFINCGGNVEGWQPSGTDPNAGTGKYGSCCTEIDIWEARKMASAYNMHAC